MPNVAIVYRQERSVSDVGRGFFVRSGSRILRGGVAKKPDVVGLVWLFVDSGSAANRELWELSTVIFVKSLGSVQTG
jgi:hypothetical protein